MLTISQIIKATGGTLEQGSQDAKIKGVSIDTRKLQKDAIYIAIEGKTHDGHKFIKEAIEKNAAAILVSKKVEVDEGVTVIRVDDTTKALGLIAKAYREKFEIPVVAITGSTGKTTVKNLVADVLGKQFQVLKNDRSENNWIGLPLTLLKLRPRHDVAVLELGTNQEGDIDWLGQIAQPHVAIFTNIGEAHLEGLKSKEGVYKEKSELIKHLPADGVIIYNQDDSYLSKLKRAKSSYRKIGYSIHQKSNYRAVIEKTEDENVTRFKLRSKRYELSVLGKHQIYNALVGIACGELFEIKGPVIKDKLKSFKLDVDRGALKNVGDIWLCDDSYNSNPISVKCALNVLSDFKTEGRKLFVCADMLELGDDAEKLHRALADDIDRSGTNLLITHGKLSKLIGEELVKMKSEVEAVHCDSQAEINKKINQFCQPKDFILVKGSRSMKMERTIQYILKTYKK